ncbi:MAG: DUF72 domain-containing protein [Gemmatimonadota bacterium]|nr:DUF72 domain-containing protein [Gemmatimonadota bacterium]
MTPDPHATATASDLDLAHDPGAREAAERARASLAGSVRPIRAAGGGTIRVGTASWTDPSLTASGVFYPAGGDTPEARLRYYASLFPLVEVDSTYYALPTRRMGELWLKRTPDHFTFDCKAYALMTGQPTEVLRFPKAIKDELPATLRQKTRLYAHELPEELYDLVWDIFLDAIAPLHSAGKLGSVLLQYPRWFLPGAENRENILDSVRRLGDVGCAVELRNALWFSDRNTDRTLAFLGENDIPFVMVDEPQGTRSSVPPLLAVTSPRLAVVRFHGRRLATWEKPNVTAVERFRYLYDKDELRPWVDRIQEASRAAREVHVIMNNCYANYGTTNAAEMGALLRAAREEDA